MKITEIETIPLSCPIPDGQEWKLGGITYDGTKGLKCDTMLIRLHTDEGLTGIGEPSPYGGVDALAAAVERLRPSFRGEDPHDVDILTDPSRGRGEGPMRYALAGLNMACWDLIGKSAGQPVSKLLGGRYTDEVEVYASGGIDWEYVEDPSILIEEARGYIDAGFGAMKFRIAPDERFITAIEALHDAVGDEIDLIVEGNARFRNVPEAVRMAERLREFEPRWFEEPIDTTNLEGYRELRRAVPDMQITGGESKPSAAAFKPWIDERAYDIVQPDANVMGISETKRVADMAREAGLAWVPHSWHNAVTMAANLQVVASVPNREILEFQRTWHWSAEPFRTELLHEPLHVTDGVMTIPDDPGLGIVLDEEALEEYAYVDGPVQESWEGPGGVPQPI